MDDTTCTEAVLAEFAALAKIPRPSGQERAASDYLCARAKALGLMARQDAALNVIVDKPAARGCESAPRTILQAHMDMVCIAAPGVAYDPLRDGIRLRRTDAYLTAEGTSLGADDGVGVAAILHLLAQDIPCGALRAIFTTDEEAGMTGAQALSPQELDAAYLINCDSEDYDVVTIGGAGSWSMDFERPAKWRAPRLEQAHRIALTGLLGGHSGMEIHLGRANAVQLLALLLQRLRQSGAAFELASLTGGKARNAIPAAAEAIVTTAPQEAKALRRIVAEEAQRLQLLYGAAEPQLRLEAQETALPSRVLENDAADGFLQLLCLLRTGVYAMSRAVPGLVETSANLGVARTASDVLAVEFMPRSAVDGAMEDIRLQQAMLAELCGFSLRLGAQSFGWPPDAKSELAALAQALFAAQNGREMRAESIHAGLECSVFYKKNPKLAMLSLGPTVTGVHTPQERLQLDTVAPHVRLLAGLLERLAQKSA